MSIYIGTSGWRYKEWGKKFYPKGMKQDEFLPFYASKFDTVEINATFYHLPNGATFEQWKHAAPPKFLFAVKMSRLVTHIMRLEGTKKFVANFLDRASGLSNKLGPILIQLPPNFKMDISKSEKFLKELRSMPQAKRRRFALEVRHASWYKPDHQKELMALLKKYRVALVFGHSSKYPYPKNEPITAKFIYLRFHGPKRFGGSLYGKQLRAWVPKIRRWARNGYDVFAYFNNDMEAYAIKDVMALRKYLSRP